MAGESYASLKLTIGNFTANLFITVLVEIWFVFCTCNNELITFDRDGLVRGERIIDTLKKLIGDSRIEDLPIKFTPLR